MSQRDWSTSLKLARAPGIEIAELVVVVFTGFTGQLYS
jgi:hypothetical protein